MNKKEFRKEMISLRKSIPDKQKKSTIIVEKIKALDKFKQSRVVALYKNMKNEVNLSLLEEYLKESGKIILFPRVIGNKLLFFYNVDIFERSSFGVQEPVYAEKNIFHGKIDLIIVPGVAFDKNNNRLGYGKGYYDLFLKNKDIYKIGVCFSEQLRDYIPIDWHDIKMDLVISDK